MFLVLGGYYMLKTAREVFILSEGGAEVKSYSSAGQALLLLVLVPAYGAFASRVNRMQLVHVGHAVLRRATSLLFLLALGAGLRIGIAVLPVGRHLQRHGDRPVLGVRQRPLHAGAGQAPVPADRRRQQPRRVARLGARRQLVLESVGTAAPAARRRASSWSSASLLVARRRPRRARGARRRRSRGDADEPLGEDQSGFELIFVGPLPDAHRRRSRAAERRQHVGRIPVRPLRRRARRTPCTAPGRRRAAAREQFIGDDLQQLLQLR